MSIKQNATGAGDEPVQVFRQFAWHLAGTLAGAAKATPARPVPKARASRASSKSAAKR